MAKSNKRNLSETKEIPVLEQVPEVELKPAYVVQINRFLARKSPYQVIKDDICIGTYSREEAIECARQINQAQFRSSLVQELYK